jgi:hypothetical protein
MAKNRKNKRNCKVFFYSLCSRSKADFKKLFESLNFWRKNIWNFCITSIRFLVVKIFDLSVILIDRKLFDLCSYSLSNYKLLHMKMLVVVVARIVLLFVLFCWVWQQKHLRFCSKEFFSKFLKKMNDKHSAHFCCQLIYRQLHCI